MPVFNPSTPELREFLIMASADTRNLIKSIEDTAAAAAADKAVQTAKDLTQSAELSNLRMLNDVAQQRITVVEEKAVMTEVFEVTAASFVVQSSGLFHAVYDLIQIVGGPAMTLNLFDADGDDQGFAQLIRNYGGNVQRVAIELTATQKNDSNYPLSLVCSGPNGVYIS